MRHFFTGILFLLFMTPPSFAQEHKHSKMEVEALLVALDEAIDNKKIYQEKRLAHADSIERDLEKCPPKLYVKKCQELFEALNDFDGKRSLDALHLIEKNSQFQEDAQLRTWVRLNQARVYATIGLYHRADAIIDAIDPKRLTAEERLNYYHTCRCVYEKIADYISDENVVQEEENKMISYFDSILALQPAGIGRDITLANKEIYLNNPKKALEIAKRSQKKAKGKEHLYLYSALADIYGQLNDRPNQLYYLAHTSLEDIKNGTTEYAALPHLISVLYEERDISRAYRYLICAMEDANFYPARNLAMEVTNNFPLINHAYDIRQAYLVHAEKMKRNSLYITFIMLSLAICVVFYLGWHHYNAQTEKKRADELQKALEQAEIADRIKTVFIQNMRHEIRTPLNAIMGFAQLMSNDLTPEERELYNGYIQESNNQLLTTLDDIIDVSNMEVGTFNFNFEDVNVDDLCTYAMENLHELLPSGVEYNYEPMQAGLTLYTDRKRVGQVLNNLLSNACKNTTEGFIKLSVAHAIANDSIYFVVTDTGKGVPADKAEVIFDHFEKLDHYSPGLGLGLYVCRLIARALGGDIYLDTSYTGGARFVFTVPKRHQTPAMPSKTDSKKP